MFVVSDHESHNFAQPLAQGQSKLPYMIVWECRHNGTLQANNVMYHRRGSAKLECDQNFTSHALAHTSIKGGSIHDKF